MTYQRFEDLPVWNAAVDLAERIYSLTEDRVFQPPGDLGDQLRRASLSVSNNIAEGFEQGTTAGLLTYLYIARGSAGETRSMLRFCDRWPRTAHLKSQISDLISLAESCSRQFRAWLEKLQNSDIAGQHHLDEQTRRAFDAKRRGEAFWRTIEEGQRRRVEEWEQAREERRDAKPPTG